MTGPRPISSTARPARQVTPQLLAGLRDAGIAILALGEPGEDGCAGGSAGRSAGWVRASPGGPAPAAGGAASAFRVSAAHREQTRARAESAARLHELTELAEIGVQLTTEKNLRHPART